MSFTTIFIIAGVILLAIFFLITRVAIRWALRLVAIAVIVVALLGAGVFWWWSNRLTSGPEPNRRRAAPTKRAPAN